ncbi:BlaI/MecI/CopY family transcriptional regulator [Olivibacter sp. SDN3]|uniref:BlaI/MecI/CopY family transcriptional regulator n=1 Tax=Olivibacter sp. SDN3 TaxID=2764720 RepID=UPI001651210F|nr:BlaI/MecI/CopY family transcriptional regulator [Olivibacter sp. SDN3]QNL50991.1 BlaI/MecI/CopY family transcriptional regulator [Olivibacter sp. SDN3]
MAVIKPTESELEILKILWEQGDSTVRQVHNLFSANKDVGYTTTLKLMQIMHAKGLLTRDETNRTHIYRALVSRDKAEQQMLGKMIHDLFEGSAARLVMQALGNHSASDLEIEKIKQLLNELENKK